MPLAARGRVDALGVQLRVDRVGSDLAGVQPGPQRGEAVVVAAATEGAGTVPGGERRHLVEEEELGEEPGLHERAALPPAELEAAGDPALDGVAPANAPARVVEAAAVPVQEPARGIGDEVAKRRDPVLERHPSSRYPRG